MAQVLVFPRGQLTDLDRARMEEAGIIAVEAEDPQRVVTLLPTTCVSGDDLFASALNAIAASPLDGVAMKFVKQLRDRLDQRRDDAA